MKKIIVKFAVVCMACFGLFSSQNVPVSASSSISKEPGEVAAPDFTLSTVKGSTVALKDFKDKGVILFFFTTWCPLCRAKVPTIAKNYETYQKEGVDFLVVNAGESRAKVSSFVAKEKAPFDVLLDSEMKVSEAYDVVGVPTFIVISKSGRIVYEDNEMPTNYKELMAK